MTKLEKELDDVLQTYFPDDYYEELRLKAVEKLAIWHKSKVKNLNIPCVSNLAKLKELAEQQQDIDPEILDAVNKIYWDLI